MIKFSNPPRHKYIKNFDDKYEISTVSEHQIVKKIDGKIFYDPGTNAMIVQNIVFDLLSEEDLKIHCEPIGWLYLDGRSLKRVKKRRKYVDIEDEEKENIEKQIEKIFNILDDYQFYYPSGSIVILKSPSYIEDAESKYTVVLNDFTNAGIRYKNKIINRLSCFEDNFNVFRTKNNI